MIHLPSRASRFPASRAAAFHLPTSRLCATLLFLTIVTSATAQLDSFPLPPLKFAPNGDLIITASPESSGKDFDFFIGKWTMHNKHLNARLANCKEFTEFESSVEDFPGLEGNGNFDVVHSQLPDGKIYEGRTVRTFDPKTGLWRLYWMDSNGGPLDPPQIGSFHNGVGLFFAKDYQVGRPVIIVFRWDKTNPDQPVWGQAFSDDNGKTWEWNYTNISYRTK